MSEAMGVIAPVDENLEAFWVHAINAARLNPAEAVMGQDEFTSLRPAAFSLGASRAEADAECAAILAGEKTVLETPAADFDAGNMPLPEVGDLAILCDGGGIPRALIVTKAVECTPAGMVAESIKVLYQR